jgi:hypothetical protein
LLFLPLNRTWSLITGGEHMPTNLIGLLMPVIWIVVALGVMAVARVVAGAASGVVAQVLDRVTWSQVKANAYGADTVGESASGAGRHPPWIKESRTLPSPIADAITAEADKAAASALKKLRSSLDALAFSPTTRGQSDVISAYLTWDELVHTSYFKNPHFRKLVAYAIARAPGFRPTEQFLSDPDYPLIERIYAEIIGKAPAIAQAAPGTKVAA